MKQDRIRKAYASSENIYDDVLTQRSFLSRMYVRIFWNGTDDRKVADEILYDIPDDFHGKILDVPSGTAVFTQQKWKSLQQAEITCLDYSRGMLKQAEERLRDCPDVHFVQGDVTDLSMQDETFDLVLSMNGFHAFQGKQKAYEEILRVLKPGGMFIGCFYVRGESSITDWLVKNLLVRHGWFTPPFITTAEWKELLLRDYRNVVVRTDGSIMLFQGVKK